MQFWTSACTETSCRLSRRHEIHKPLAVRANENWKVRRAWANLLALHGALMFKRSVPDSLSLNTLVLFDLSLPHLWFSLPSLGDFMLFKYLLTKPLSGTSGSNQISTLRKKWENRKQITESVFEIQHQVNF